jgi:hypothetical protein
VVFFYITGDKKCHENKKRLFGKILCLAFPILGVQTNFQNTVSSYDCHISSYIKEHLNVKGYVEGNICSY